MGSADSPVCIQAVLLHLDLEPFHKFDCVMSHDTQSGLNSTLYFHFECERILHASLSVCNPRPKASSSKGIVVRFG